jgi:hypothetical protein
MLCVSIGSLQTSICVCRVGRRSTQDKETVAASAAAAAAAAGAGPGSNAGSLAPGRLRAADLKYRVVTKKGVRFISYNDVRKVGVAFAGLDLLLLMWREREDSPYRDSVGPRDMRMSCSFSATLF